MAKTGYRITPPRKETACDVEMTEPGAAPFVVDTFNTDAEAWGWSNERRRAAKFAARPPSNASKKD